MKPFDIMRMRSADEAVFSYFDPLKCGAGIVLSEPGNRRLGTANVGAWKSGLAVAGIASGKRYFEIEHTSMASDWAFFHGLVSIEQALNDYLTMGAGVQGLAYRPGYGDLFVSGSTVGWPGAVSVGSYSRWVYDAAAGHIWMGTPSAWAGGGDPEEGESPTATVTPGKVLYPAASPYNELSASCRLRLRASDMVGLVPAGCTTA